METKLKLIEILEKHPKGIHLREISRKLNTGLPNVIRYADILEKDNIIQRFKDANLIKLKLKKSPKTVAYLNLIHTERYTKLPKKIQLAITDILKELKTKPLITLIFGSYAKGTPNKGSDLDILFVFQKTDNKEIENITKRISTRTNLKISPIYLNYDIFEKNFLDKKHEFSKEIRKDVIILTGTELYYNLLWSFLE